MKTSIKIAALVALATVSSAAAADFYTQNFDGMGTSGTTPPAGWLVRYISGNGLSLTVPTSAEMAGSSLGSPTSLLVWNQTDSPVSWSQQAANEGASPSASNRLLGTSPSGTRGTILQLNLLNNSGGPVAKIGLSYDMQLMADGVLTGGFEPGSIDELPGYSFYFLDGSTWTHVPSLDLAATGTASASFWYTTPVANGATMQFRWFDDNAYAYSPDTMYAIDNVILNIPEPGTLSLLGLGALSLVFRRRKA
jgi:hypothetical protein